MTLLSVNLNKIALLRNSRGHDYPNVLDYARRFMALGVQGITVHPRPDQRHITRKDAYDLAELLAEHPDVEFNIEGYPSEDFLRLVEDCRPSQCTLVPDDASQLTSDHGWDMQRHGERLRPLIAGLQDSGIRVAVFLDPELAQLQAAAASGAERIELYTEAWARSHGSSQAEAVLAQYRKTALQAAALGLGSNAGHDLNLQNLPDFLSIPGILEVSIGHALIVECIDMGMERVVQRYLEICRHSKREPSQES